LNARSRSVWQRAGTIAMDATMAHALSALMNHCAAGFSNERHRRSDPALTPNAAPRRL